MVAAVVQWNFNGQALAFGGADRIELARRLKKVSTGGDVDAAFEVWNGRWLSGQGQVFVSADVRLKDDAADDCLTDLADSTNDHQLILANLNPNVKTTHLKGVSKQFVSISNSHVSIQQLSDLLNGASYDILNNITIAESESKGMLGNLSNIHVHGTRPGETAKLLKAFDKTKFKGRVTIQQVRVSEELLPGNAPEEEPAVEQLNADDWKQIFECGQFFEISVYRKPSKEAMEYAKAKFLGQGVFLSASTNDSEFWDLVCNTQVSQSMSLPSSKEPIEKFFDAVFASHGELWASRVFNELFIGSSDIKNFVFTEDSPWVFKRNQEGTPTGMLLPGNEVFINRVSEFVDLEVLSLDVRWLQSLQKIADSRIPLSSDVSPLGNLTKLKRLDMPLGFWGRDYSFLGQLPDLEHLQFDVMADGSKNIVFGFKAANCPSLKSLVLVGKPSKAMAIEIGKLPNLKSLKVLDVNQSLVTPKSISQLQAAIGAGVELTVVVADEERPSVPEEFAKHLEKIRSGIRKKYLGAEE